MGNLCYAKQRNHLSFRCKAKQRSRWSFTSRTVSQLMKNVVETLLFFFYKISDFQKHAICTQIFRN